MKYIKAGYVGCRGLASVTESAARQLDVINIAFGHCVDSAATFTFDCKEALGRIRSFNPNIRVLLSIGGWGAGGFSPMAATDAGRKKFAETSLAILNEYKLDGIDIDWEYPCIDSAGIEASPDDRVNFTLMLAQMRSTLDTVKTAAHSDRPWVTIAVGSGEYFIENTEMDKVAALCDYVSIMTYDIRGSWLHHTAHHTNLMPYDEKDLGSAAHSVKIYNAAGVPFDKIVIGAAFYSRKWTGVEPGGSGLGSNAQSTGGYGPSFHDLAANYINKNGYVRYFDETARAPYLFNGDTFISYDDEQSVREKCEFVKAQKLLGIMYWEHDCDNTGTLLSVIDETLK